MDAARNFIPPSFLSPSFIGLVGFHRRNFRNTSADPDRSLDVVTRDRTFPYDAYPRANTIAIWTGSSILSGDRAHIERRPLRFYHGLIRSAIRGVNPIERSVRASGDYVQLAAISALLGSFAARRALDPIG
jgi:hypothetical protein